MSPAGSVRPARGVWRALARLAISVTVAAGAAALIAHRSVATAGERQTSDPVGAIVAGMSLDDKVGQLFMLGFASSDVGAALPLLTELRVGGIVLTDNVSDAISARALTSALQNQAAGNDLLPLLIAVNHEGGNVQPINGGMTVFPPQWNLGEIQPTKAAVAAACDRGDVMGRELAAIGISMNLAPDLDVWDNPANTVIARRSFSSDPTTVAELGSAYIEALQNHGVLAVGKHFPGHGSSTEDSHAALPIIRHDRAWLDAHELVPFQAAIQANVAAIMVGHLSFPLIDPDPNRPSSLSSVFITDILRTELGYGGLVVTDDLGAMKAVTAGYTPGSAAVLALQAGVDVLLSVGPLASEREMVAAVKAAVGSSISPARVDASVRRVLQAKMQAGLLRGEAPPLTPDSPVCTPAS